MWTQDLLKTYALLEKDGKVGAYENNDKYMPLAPIYHITGASSTNIIITDAGELVDICELSAKVILPVTVDSMSRTSGACANPYMDNLEYYIDEEKRELLLDLLGKWKGDNICLNAIYKYVSSKALASTEKELKKDTIRWSVQMSDTGEIIDTWKDESLMKLWISYYSNLINTADTLPSKSLTHGTCMITGEDGIVVSSSLRGVTAAGSMARIICDSSKNSTCTHGGRLNEVEQCYTMGVETAFKVFNTFKYVCFNDNIYCKSTGDSFAMWSPEGIKLDDVTAEKLSPLRYRLYQDQKVNYKSYKKDLHDLLFTHKDSIKDSDSVVLMTLKTLTSGRTSISSYNKLSYSRYLTNISNWESGLAQPWGNDDTYVPSISDILNLAYGVPDKKGYLNCQHDIVFSNKFQQLMLCRFKGEKIPTDITRNLINKCKSMFLYKSQPKLLATTVACIRYNLNEEINQMVKEDFTDINYTYGRLLAVYQKLEQDADPDNKKRVTNAERYESAYMANPSKIMSVLESKTVCYRNKLNPGLRVYYSKMINTLRGQISQYGKPVRTLNEQFLLGYSDQMNAFYTKKSEENVENTIDIPEEV